ncbi:MAG TPA: response regulator transcription factor [Solirubrobacter sp.]|nr:response regulator transcription factor [Solirubrobacter sp.]
MTTTIRVAIVEDQALIRTGLRMILDAADGIDVVGEAADGDGVQDLVRRTRPDVVLMDIRMPTIDGIEATRRLVATGSPAKVVILTTFDLDAHVYDALRAGASGFLVKDGPAEEMLAAVRAVAAGESLLSPSVTRRVIAAFVKTHVARLLQKTGSRDRLQVVIAAYDAGLVAPRSGAR